MAEPDAVVWHDLECGAYAADLPVWRELAATTEGAVLDVGAGTGRVALDLARRGSDVIALDHDPALLAALEERARAEALPVATVRADARSFDLGRRVGLCVAPMQTIQLLGGREGRTRYLDCVRAHLAPGGRIAAALADAMEGFDDEAVGLPLPDMDERDGWVYSSQPVALRREDGGIAIERRRDRVAPDGVRSESTDIVQLDDVTAAQLEREGEASGLRVLPRRHIAATEEHVGSVVVLLGV
jgi:SAM-dependent methyltransferase